MENSVEPLVKLRLPEDLEANLPGKRRGEIAELAFMRKAIALGFSVAKPWGESDRYDVIINDRDIFWRVQVKSVWGGSRYCVKTTGHRRVPYTADEIDFLVAYVNPKNVWYVLPISQIASRKHLYLRPFRWKSKYEQYRDAWHLFREVDSQ